MDLDRTDAACAHPCEGGASRPSARWLSQFHSKRAEDQEAQSGGIDPGGSPFSIKSVSRIAVVSAEGPSNLSERADVVVHSPHELSGLLALL